MEVVLLATPRRPVDGQATCAHAQAAFFRRYRFSDPWRSVERPTLGRLAAALRALGETVALGDPEADPAGAEAIFEGRPPPGLVAVELDDVLHLPGFRASLAHVAAAGRGAPVIAAGRLAAANPQACFSTFPALHGVVGPDPQGRWRVQGRSSDPPEPLTTLRNRSVFAFAPDRSRLLQHLDRDGQRPPALLDDPFVCGGEAAAAVAALDPRVNRVILTEPVPLRLLPSFLREFEAVIGARRAMLSLATRLDGSTARDAEAAAAHLTRAGRGSVARLSFTANPEDFSGSAGVLLSAGRQVGLPMQPLVRLVTTNAEIDEIARRIACLRAAPLHRLDRPGLLLNGLGLLPGDLDDGGAAWVHRAFALATPGPAPDFASWVAWRCPRTAILWGSLRPLAVELHERSAARIPALLLGLRGRDVDVRRALVGLRAGLGGILLRLAHDAAHILATRPETGRSELGGLMARRLAEADISHLGHPFDEVLERIAVRGPAEPLSGALRRNASGFA